MEPNDLTWQQTVGRWVGTLCATALVTVGVCVLLIGAGTYLAIAAKLFYYGWRAGWGLW